MADREEKQEVNWLLRLTLVLGAVLGTVVGGEMAAGLGAGGLVLGWLTGAVFGTALGYYAGKSNAHRKGDLRSPVEIHKAPAIREEIPQEKSSGLGSHVARLMEERERPSEPDRKR